MSNQMNKCESRREFLKGGLRKIALSCLVIIAGLLGWRALFKGNSTSACINNPCKDCLKLSACKELRAIDFRKNQDLAKQINVSSEKGMKNGE